MTKDEAYENLETKKVWRLCKVVYIAGSFYTIFIVISKFHHSIFKPPRRSGIFNTNNDASADMGAFLLGAYIIIALALVVSFLLFRLLRRVTVYVLYGSLGSEWPPQAPEP
jgi:hypothetical protein